MNFILLAISFSFGICFAAICMAITWIADTRDTHRHLKEARKAEYANGYEDGFNAGMEAGKIYDEIVIEEMDEEIQKLWQEMDRLY